MLHFFASFPTNPFPYSLLRGHFVYAFSDIVSLLIRFPYQCLPMAHSRLLRQHTSPSLSSAPHHGSLASPLSAPLWLTSVVERTPVAHLLWSTSHGLSVIFLDDRCLPQRSMISSYLDSWLCQWWQLDLLPKNVFWEEGSSLAWGIGGWIWGVENYFFLGLRLGKCWSTKIPLKYFGIRRLLEIF